MADGSSGGGPPLVAAAAAAADARAEAAAACRFDGSLQFFALLMHGATQAMSLMAWRSLPASEIFQRVASTLLVAAFWLLPSVAPTQKWYMRWRKPCFLASRIQFFMWPLLRKARGATAAAARLPAAVPWPAGQPRGPAAGAHTAPLLPTPAPQASSLFWTRSRSWG